MKQELQQRKIFKLKKIKIKEKQRYFNIYLNLFYLDNYLINKKKCNCATIYSKYQRFFKLQKYFTSKFDIQQINNNTIASSNREKEIRIHSPFKNQLKDRIILHVDANNFYASVECAFNSNLKNKPVAVSGDPTKRNGIILAKNQIAKSFGVLTGEAIWQAKEKCPNLICLPPRMPLYEEYSKHLRDIYKKYTHLVEPFGIDECWLDITETHKIFGFSLKIASDIREEVKKSLNITVSVGISFCKLFAKLGSDLKKPDAVTCIYRENFKQIVYPLPITEIIGIGNRLEKRFNKLNIYTLGDITKTEDFILKKIFGIIGINLKQKLLGNDIDPVASSLQQQPPKSIGNGTTTTYDIFSEEEIKATVIFLAHQICPRLREQQLFAKRISVSIKDCTLKKQHHSRVLPFPTQTEREITYLTMQLINSFWKYKEKIRAIRISVSQLSDANIQQISMFENYEKRKNQFNQSLDKLNLKYGKKTLQPAILKVSPFLREGFQLHRPTQA